MASVTTIKGFDNVMSNLNREIEGIKNRSMQGLIMSAAYVRQQTEKVAPLTPVDLGNLRASWFVVTAQRVAVGQGPKFKGIIASKMTPEHAATVNEAQGIVATSSTGKKKFLMMGYSANYALWVHENIGAEFKRTGAGPKWLESAFKRSAPKIILIIKDHAQIKRTR